jgi:hypothetical protein
MQKFQVRRLLLANAPHVPLLVKSLITGLFIGIVLLTKFISKLFLSRLFDANPIHLVRLECIAAFASIRYLRIQIR